MHKITHGQLQRALNLRLQGYTWNSIYDRIKVTAGPVIQYARQHGMYKLIYRLRGKK